MSSNKDFLPSSSPTSSILRHQEWSNPFPFHEELLQVFIPRMYYNYRIENRAYEEPAATLFTRKDGIPPPPVGLSWNSPHPPPESVRTDGRTDGRTLTSEPKFFASTGYQICLPMVLRELRNKVTRKNVKIYNNRKWNIIRFIYKIWYDKRYVYFTLPLTIPY